MRVGGRFAGEVPGVELGEGGVEVVEVEHDARRDPIVGVDLDEAEHLGVELPRVRIAARERDTNEARRSPRVAMTVDVMFVTPTPRRSHVRDLGISTVSDSGVHHPTAIVGGKVVGQYLVPWRPSRGPRRCARKRSSAWLAAFSSRRVPAG